MSESGTQEQKGLNPISSMLNVCPAVNCNFCPMFTLLFGFYFSSSCWLA